ncbi:hypothetical protein FGADI_1395 [Fusarium gaditjirri]|uniref:Uncharacterized protein n=1 Tax=Fusarium gaditjirri TaxID=282569 RepID=A0A8H4TLF4_9HYPO|nr:hypothetical protein FGADI_1395 [Fusarium gaditjirri]
MRLSLPFIVFCAAPAVAGLALPDSPFKIKEYEHKDHDHHDPDLVKHHHKDHDHKHKHLHPHEHVHITKHKHPIKPCPILTEDKTCKLFHYATKDVEELIHAVQTYDCGNDAECWHKIVYRIYILEYGLDAFDKYVDSTTLKKCFSCGNDSPYADALIRLLRLLRHQTKTLDGEVERPVLTAINSLRVSNYALVYEIGRRVECKKSLKIIMSKQGANDGSTKGSVQAAFEKFPYTPLITGENFKDGVSLDKTKDEEDSKGDGEHKHKKVHKHYHNHHHGHKHGHKHENEHHYEHKHDDEDHHDHHDEEPRTRPRTRKIFGRGAFSGDLKALKVPAEKKKKKKKKKKKLGIVKIENSEVAIRNADP